MNNNTKEIMAELKSAAEQIQTINQDAARKGTVLVSELRRELAEGLPCFDNDANRLHGHICAPYLKVSESLQKLARAEKPKGYRYGVVDMYTEISVYINAEQSPYPIIDFSVSIGSRVVGRKYYMQEDGSYLRKTRGSTVACGLKDIWNELAPFKAIDSKEWTSPQYYNDLSPYLRELFKGQEDLLRLS